MPARRSLIALFLTLLVCAPANAGTPHVSTHAQFTSLTAPWGRANVRGAQSGAEGTVRGVADGGNSESQWQAARGDGTYVNPVLGGDHPDPSIIRDGDDWYAVFSTFDSYPGLVIWKSHDLLDWQPVTAALTQDVGSIWAPCIVKYKGRYLIYFPGRTDSYRSNYVIAADRIEGPWSAPIDLHLPKHIDPGFAVGEDGRPYLFLSGGDRVALSDDGMATAGPVTHVTDPFIYPEDWDVESMSTEGPKITQHGGWFYMIWAEGGTAGPPTGHMVVVARSKSINGPWQLDPHNPILRTRNKSETWWSKGHGSLVETPAGWYMVYHAYRNGFMTLGRQMLMEPVTWTDDGWFRMTGDDSAAPQPAPYPLAAAPGPGLPLSDDFAASSMGVRWSFFKGGNLGKEGGRASFGPNGLTLAPQGTAPVDSPPLLENAPDEAYEIETELTLDPGATAGVILFYNDRLYAGLGVSHDKLILHRYGTERPGAKPAILGDHLFIRMRNDRNILTFFTSPDGAAWTKYGVQMEVSGYNHNTGGGFLALRPGVYAAGSGAAHFRYWRYRALKDSN